MAAWPMLVDFCNFPEQLTHTLQAIFLDVTSTTALCGATITLIHAFSNSLPETTNACKFSTKDLEQNHADWFGPNAIATRSLWHIPAKTQTRNNEPPIRPSSLTEQEAQ